jgi:hypothetical protein
LLFDFSQQVLRTDASGMPLGWINYQEAASCYHAGSVLYACGKPLYTVHGGVNGVSGLQSRIEINSIIATAGEPQSKWHHKANYTPPLTNKTLFARDAHCCLYCGTQHYYSDLSRDHVTPLSQAGLNTWCNVVTSCKRCNNFKAGRTPEQAHMQLIAIPFAPTHAEYVFLRGRRILADQMEFLMAHFPRSSPLRDRA